MKAKGGWFLFWWVEETMQNYNVVQLSHSFTNRLTLFPCFSSRLGGYAFSLNSNNSDVYPHVSNPFTFNYLTMYIQVNNVTPFISLISSFFCYYHHHHYRLVVSRSTIRTHFLRLTTFTKYKASSLHHQHT